MIVYRLEDKEGWGPFTYKKDWPKDYNDDNAIHSHRGCTVPHDLFPLGRRQNYRFGCSSIEKLNKYWGGQLDKWKSNGWIVATYKVRKNYVLTGLNDIELAFLVEKAVRV